MAVQSEGSGGKQYWIECQMHTILSNKSRFFARMSQKILVSVRLLAAPEPTYYFKVVVSTTIGSSCQSCRKILWLWPLH